jgi:beta-glucosidase
MVLLKNEGRLLPLDKSRVKRLAVIGPLADANRAQLGTWVPDGREEESRTPLAAMRESAGNIQVLYARGLEDELNEAKTGFEEAVSAARRAEVVLLVVGEGSELSGEARSRAKLDLPGAQNELIDAVAAVGKPLVLVVQAGRPLTIGRQITKADAVLYSFHAGTMAGPAMADLVWGIESPSGRLPVTFPKAVGQVPLYYNHANTGRPPRPYDFARDSRSPERINTKLGYNSNYIDVGPYPLFPFGYGLSYTRFEYGPVELSATRLRAKDVLAVRARITNAGDRAADEVAQLYVRDVAGTLVRPVRELRGFRRIHLEAGRSQIVEFALPMDELAFFNNQEQRVLEPGKFEIYVGGSSLAPLAGSFEIVD